MLPLSQLKIKITTMVKRFYLDEIPPISTTGTAPGRNINNPLQVGSKIWIDYVTRNMDINTVRRNLYDYLNPRGYEATPKANMERFVNAINKKPDGDIRQNVLMDGYGYDPYLDDIWATYLNIPEKDRHTYFNNPVWNEGLGVKKVIPSKYKPTKGNENHKYFTLTNINNKELEQLVREGAKLDYNQSTTSEALYHPFLTHTISKGRDNKGTYVSFYDLWDVAPINGTKEYQGNYSDQSGGIGQPIHFYDRIYLDDYYGVPKDPKSTYIPEVIIEPDIEWKRKHYPKGYY